MSDRELLIELFRGTKGQFWTRKDNWTSSETCRRWFGIQVNSSGHICVINLRRNFLQESLDRVVSWRMLTNIHTLCLSENKLSGNIPAQIGDIPSIEELDLSWNEFEGTIPIELFRLVNLRVLRLEHNHLEGSLPIDLRCLQKLRFLNLSMNNLTGIVPAVGHFLPELKILDLSNNQFEGYVPSLVREFLEYSSEDRESSKDDLESLVA